VELPPKGSDIGDVKPSTATGSPKFAGPMDATSREKENNVNMVFGGYQAHAETIITGPPEPRKNYAGKIVNGKFQKTKAATLGDLSDEERLQVMADLQADKERRAEQLKQKKQIEAFKKKMEKAKVAKKKEEQAKAKRMEKAKSKSVGKFTDEFMPKPEQQMPRKLLMQAALEKARTQEDTADRFEQDMAAHRDRRLMIQEKRRITAEQQLAMKGGAGGGYNATATQEAFPAGVLHRHVHHHMHYHGDGDDVSTMVRTNTEPFLPQLATDGFRGGGGLNGGLRRNQSEAAFSSGQVLPPLRRGAAGGGIPQMRATAS
jgi:hypothetical protein